VDRRAGDIVQIYADTAIANTELGWKTEKSLDDMVKSTWKWEQKLEAQR
jgi:UDP-glucose 4-epimerase